MKAHHLGHVVFYVKDLERSLAFYRDLVGFQEIGRTFGGKAAALTSGRTHHELLLIEVGDAPPPPTGERRGLYHIGIKIGDSLNTLREAKKELEQAGVRITGMSDHTVTQSLYLHDPDGNEVELYVDSQAINWEQNPALVLSPVSAAQDMKVRFQLLGPCSSLLKQKFMRSHYSVFLNLHLMRYDHGDAISI